MANVPGPKTPEKYGKVGPNYLKWGEQAWAGYSYNPETDRYYADPEAKAMYDAEVQKKLKDKYEEKPKEPPSVWEQGMAMALPTLATTGAKYALGGLLGLGGTKATSALDDLFSGPIAAPIPGGELIGPGLGSMTGGFADAISDVGEGIWDVGGDILGGIGDYASDAYDWVTGLF